MSLWTAIAKAAAVWAKHGDKIERTLEIWAADDDAPAPAKPPSEAVGELRKVIGTKPLTDDERRWMDRASG